MEDPFQPGRCKNKLMSASKKVRTETKCCVPIMLNVGKMERVACGRISSLGVCSFSQGAPCLRCSDYFNMHLDQDQKDTYFKAVETQDTVSFFDTQTTYTLILYNKMVQANVERNTNSAEMMARTLSRITNDSIQSVSNMGERQLHLQTGTVQLQQHTDDSFQAMQFGRTQRMLALSGATTSSSSSTAEAQKSVIDDLMKERQAMRSELESIQLRCAELELENMKLKHKEVEPASYEEEDEEEVELASNEGEVELASYEEQIED